MRDSKSLNVWDSWTAPPRMERMSFIVVGVVQVVDVVGGATPTDRNNECEVGV